MEKSCNKWTLQQEAAFQNLVEECLNNPPKMKLSSRLRKELKRLEPGDLREVVTSILDGCCPLFMACRSGNLKIVNYLLKTCGADVNQRSEYQRSNFTNEKGVTPLWLAVETGNLPMIRALADAGADLNAGSYKGSTPLTLACESLRDDVVAFLIARGADIQRTNYKGETCLMKLLHCVPLCEILVKNGINVNARSTYGITALHLSVQKNNKFLTSLLLRHGADPYVPLPEGGDVLQLACLIGSIAMVKLLIREVRYPHEHLANMRDLLGATLHLKQYNVEGALAQWRRSLVLRKQHQLPKRPEVAPRVALQFNREFCNEHELVAAATFRSTLETQALLVYERLLGSGVHHAFCNLALSCGLRYAKIMQHQRCVDLLLWVMEVCVRNPELESEMCNTARELTRLFLHAHKGIINLVDRIPRIQDVFQAFSLLADSLSAWRHALDVQSKCVHLYVESCIKQRVSKRRAFNDVIEYFTHLLDLLLSMLETEENIEEGQSLAKILHKKLYCLVAQDLRNCDSGDTLLHLCVSLDTHSLFLCDKLSNGPSLRCVNALLAAGAEANSVNKAGRTPLHLVASQTSGNNLEVVLKLLDAGAHIDQSDKTGRTPVALLAANPDNPLPCIPLLRYQTLKCLAVNAVVRHKVKVLPGDLPKEVMQFLQMHK